jgi:hypothetical protein
MLFLVILEAVKAPSGRPSLASLSGRARDGRPQDVEYGTAWHAPETPFKFCLLFATFRFTVDEFHDQGDNLTKE